MQMTFGHMSEPLTKVQKVDSTRTAQSYDFTYRYEDDSHPTAPTQVGHDHYTYDANGFLVRGELVPGQGSKLYRLSTDELPYAACVQLILSNGSSTEIVGIDGKRNVKVVERYTPDGQRVSAPVSGINIEKLSDGTTRKVFVQK